MYIEFLWRVSVFDRIYYEMRYFSPYFIKINQKIQRTYYIHRNTTPLAHTNTFHGVHLNTVTLTEMIDSDIYNFGILILEFININLAIFLSLNASADIFSFLSLM